MMGFCVLVDCLLFFASQKKVTMKTLGIVKLSVEIKGGRTVSLFTATR